MSAPRRIVSLAAGLGLAGAVALAAFSWGSTAPVPRRGPEAVPVRAYPITHFRRSGAADPVFGPFTFRGGLELRGAHRDFGGLSAFRVADDGTAFVAVTDTGDLVRGRLTYDPSGRRATGLADVTIVPLARPHGTTNRPWARADAEALALAPGVAYVAFERPHALMRYPIGPDGAFGTPEALPLPAMTQSWWWNQGIEALVVLERGPLAGQLLAIAERTRDPDWTEGFVLDPADGRAIGFRLRRAGGFSVTDIDLLADGSALLLERDFSPFRGVALQLRRLRLDGLRDGALLEAEVLLTVRADHHIDNMEGLSAHRNPAGERVITLVSDDNFSIVQRTLLLQFRLPEGW